MFKKNDWIFGLISVAIGVFVLLNINTLAHMSHPGDPAGPAALPQIIAVAMLIIGAIHIIFPLMMKKKDSAPSEKKKDISIKPVVLIVIASVVFIMLLDVIGYPIGMLLLVAAIMWAVGQRNMKKIAVTSITTTVVLFVAFFYVLSVNLPLGILESLLGR